DTGAAGTDRSRTAVSGEAPQCAGASGSDDDSSACRPGAGAHRAGEHGSRTSQELRRTLTQLQCAQRESGESRRLESGTTSIPAAVAGSHRIGQRAHCRIQPADRETGARELSASRPAEAGEGSRYADRTDVSTDAGRPASVLEEPRRGRLSRTAARTEELGTERAADAYQQGRRSVPAHAAGARSTTHPGTVRRRLRSQALGTEAGGR